MDAFYRYACGSAADFFITDPCFRWEWAKMEASFNAVKANMVATKSAREGCFYILGVWIAMVQSKMVYDSKNWLWIGVFLGFTFWSTPIWGLNRGGAWWCTEDPTLAMTGTMASLEQGCMNLLFGITFRFSRLAVKHPLRTAWWQRIKN